MLIRQKNKTVWLLQESPPLRGGSDITEPRELRNGSDITEQRPLRTGDTITEGRSLQNCVSPSARHQRLIEEIHGALAGDFF